MPSAKNSYRWGHFTGQGQQYDDHHNSDAPCPVIELWNTLHDSDDDPATSCKRAMSIVMSRSCGLDKRFVDRDFPKDSYYNNLPPNLVYSTPLILAAIARRPDVIKALVDAGAKVLAANDSHVSAVSAVIEAHDIASLNVLLSAKMNKHDKKMLLGIPNKTSPLHLAALVGFAPAIKLLVDAGADMELTDESKLTPLQHAALNNQGETTEALLSAGALYTPKAKYVGKPLLFTVASNVETDPANAKVIQAILNYGISVNSFDGIQGDTPLHEASKCNPNPESIEMIIDHGASIDARNSQNETPLHLAVRHDNYRAIMSLLNHGANIELRDINGYTPLHLGYTDSSVALLIARGANVNAKDNCGSTPLHMAAKCGRVEVLRLLLESGAKLEERDEDGCTPLHMASLFCRVDGIRYLISKGANVNTRDNECMTSIDLVSKVDVSYALRNATLRALHGYD